MSYSFDINEAIREFDKTPSWGAVAKKLGVHPYSIQHALEPMGKKSIKSVGQRRKWDIEQAIKMRESMSVRAIAKELGVSEVAIRKGIKEFEEGSK